MHLFIILTFILGYLVIALEHNVKIDKAATALFTGIVVWTIYITQTPGHELVIEQLIEHLGDISQIIFFLIGAMTIVELIDAYRGFDLITQVIKTNQKRTLLIIISFITFFLSAVLDNLTTTIVMITLLRKMIKDKNDRWLFGGMVVIAANAGGAWTPIGDVTTTMLWIGGQITAGNIMQKLILPSLLSMIVPLALISFKVKGNLESIKLTNELSVSKRDKYLVFFLGIGALVFVPIFKTITHLPPFMGILLGLSVLWIVTEFLHKNKEKASKITVTDALKKIDIPSILFFLGILIAVGALASTNILTDLANYLNHTVNNLEAIAVTLGILSSIVDNVPLVAASMGMYDLTKFPVDHYFWELIAYCAGTGGSILIIGSAAGVAAMGIDKIDFFWYFKKISIYALFGYLAGALSYIAFL